MFLLLNAKPELHLLKLNEKFLSKKMLLTFLYKMVQFSRGHSKSVLILLKDSDIELVQFSYGRFQLKLAL
jgi:hypothetical protein